MNNQCFINKGYIKALINVFILTNRKLAVSQQQRSEQFPTTPHRAIAAPSQDLEKSYLTLIAF
jgi:hypothetical protein